MNGTPVAEVSQISFFLFLQKVRGTGPVESLVNRDAIQPTRRDIDRACGVGKKSVQLHSWMISDYLRFIASVYL